MWGERRGLKSSTTIKIRTSSSVSIQHLHDDLLLNILCRLPSETVFSCKCVSRSWFLLLSKPRFVVSFLNHKIRQHTIERIAPLGWTFMLRLTEENRTVDACAKTSDRIVFTLSSWKSAFDEFTNEFLSRKMEVAATFKDLILCYNTKQVTGEIVFHICNPLTMKWVTLPLSPFPFCSKHEFRAALICEEPYQYDKDEGIITKYCDTDYRFRVVVVVVRNPEKFSFVFCSEIRQWKKVHLVFPTNNARVIYNPNKGFQVMVWRKMLCLRHNFRLAAFDPFDITAATTDGAAVAARKMLSPEPEANMLILVESTVVESEGQLNKVCVRSIGGLNLRKYTPSEIDGLPDKWEAVRTLKLNGANKYLLSANPDSCVRRLSLVGMDPRNKDLVYLWNKGANSKLILCNVGTQSVKPLNFRVLPSYNLVDAHRLEFQWWPTPIPVTLSAN